MYIFLLKHEKLLIVLFRKIHQLLRKIIVLNEVRLVFVPRLIFKLEVQELELRSQIFLSLNQSLLVLRECLGLLEVIDFIALTCFQRIQVDILKLQIIDVYLGLIFEECLACHFLISLQIFI